MNKRQKNTYGTALKWDGVYQGIEEEEVRSRAFRSSRAKRFDFKSQDKKEFQDEEDLLSELAHLKLVCNYRDLTEGLDIQLKEFEKNGTQSAVVIPSGGVTDKKPKRKKVKLTYHYEDEEDTDAKELDIKLKSVDSKLKFQRTLPKQLATTIPKQMTDPIYKSFTKNVQSSIPKSKAIIPEDYEPKYKLGHASNAPLSKYTATSLLSSRFTGSSPNPEERASQTERQPRIVQKIEVSDLLKKRLGL